MVVVSGEEGGNAAVEGLMDSGNYLKKSSVWVSYPLPLLALFEAVLCNSLNWFSGSLFLQQSFMSFTSLSQGYVLKTGLCPRVDVELLWSY